MKKGLKSLLSLALSVVMLAATLPTAMAASTGVVKDDMKWQDWSDANYLEGTSYYVGALSKDNTWNGYITRTGGNAKHQISDSNTTDANYTKYNIDYRIYQTLDANGNGSDPIVPPSNGGAWGFVGHNYQKLETASKSKIPDDLWLGVKDISAYKDNGYVVFVTQTNYTPTQYDDLYFAITAVADNKSFKGYEESGISLPVTKAGNEDAVWDDHIATAVAGVKLADYYDLSVKGGQTVIIPLARFVDNPDFLEFGSNSYSKLQELYNEENYKINLQLYSGMGIAKRDRAKALFSELRYQDLAIISLGDAKNLTASVNQNAVNLSWDAVPETDATYRITRTLNGVSEVIAEGIKTASYTDSVAENGTYTYKVQAYNELYGLETKESNAVEAVVAVEGELVVPAENLLLEDFVIPTGGSSDSAKAKPQPFFMGDFYVSSNGGGTLDVTRFQPNGYYISGVPSSDAQRWYLNDTGYITEEGNDLLNKGRAITYRPKAAGEYNAVRVNGSDTYIVDAYTPIFVGVLNDGTKVPEEWIHDNWGFNGYRYANNAYIGNWRDLTEFKDNGKIIFNVNVPSGMNIEGVYLSVTHTDSTYWIKDDGTHSAETAVGVPLKNYYDTTKGGWQTIAVPFSDFDFTKNGGNNDVFVHTSYKGDTFVLHTQYDQYRKYNNMHWESFTGIGIVREDVDSSKCEEFYMDVKNLAIVNDTTKTPELTAEFDADAKKVVLNWTGSGYTDTTYTITKTYNGKTETINAGAVTEYADGNIKDGDYTYTVESSVGKYALAKTSNSSQVAVTGVGGGKVSTVKKVFNWVDYYPAGDWRNYLEGSTYNVGTVSYWNNFTYPWRWDKADAKQIIADSSVGGDSAINYKLTDPIGTEGNPVLDIGISNDGAFGYLGHSFAELGGYPDQSKIPDDVWMGVKDLSAYKDNGYVVFTITAATNVEDAYLCIMGPADNWQFSGFLPNKEGMWPITRETHQGLKWGFGTVAINGVKLTDYYDVSKGGTQKVAIPLSKLVDDPDFKEFAGKTIESITKYYEKESHTFDLSLFSGMGVAKRDTDKGETMTVRYTNLEIVAVETPANFDVELNGNAATLMWDETNDLDVEYKVYRNGEVIATTDDTSYVDANLADGVYTYEVAAYDKTYKVTSAKPSVEVVVGTVDPVISIKEVDMGSYAGKAWDVVVEYFNGAKSYIATFTDGTETKTGTVEFESVETDGASVEFAVFLHTSRAKVALGITAE